ncbi:hypothetical protein ACFQ4J_10145 [Laceyella tengchongensis]|jgi:hypothetical protein
MHVVRTLALPRVGHVDGVLHSRLRTPRGSNRTTMCIDCGCLSTVKTALGALIEAKNGSVSVKPPLGAGGALVRKETGKVDHSQRFFSKQLENRENNGSIYPN